jgi:hypothetical protein
VLRGGRPPGYDLGELDRCLADRNAEVRVCRGEPVASPAREPEHRLTR